jgi:hypothetical protein
MAAVQPGALAPGSDVTNKQTVGKILIPYILTQHFHNNFALLSTHFSRNVTTPRYIQYSDQWLQWADDNNVSAGIQGKYMLASLGHRW